MHLHDMGDCTHIWELQCTLAVYTAFKTESNAIEFAKGELDSMDAGLQALRSSHGQFSRCGKQLHWMRSGDHGSWLSYIGVGIRAFFFAQGPGLSSKCSREVLDRQLVSAVLRSSVR